MLFNIDKYHKLIFRFTIKRIKFYIFLFII